MKYQQQEQLAKTSCKNCAFAVYSNDTQTGCKHGRVEKFKKQNRVIEAYDLEKEFYVIKQFCNYYRKHKNEQEKEYVELVKGESATSFEVIIKSNLEQVKEHLEKSINTLQYFLDYSKVRVNFIIDATCEKLNKDTIMELISLSKIPLSVYECYDTNKSLHGLVLKSKNNYHIFCENLEDADALHRINDYINNQLNKALIFESKSGNFVSNTMYKLQYNLEGSQDYFYNMRKIKEALKNSKMCVKI